MPSNTVFLEASKLVSTKTPITKALLLPSRIVRIPADQKWVTCCHAFQLSWFRINVDVVT